MIALNQTLDEMFDAPLAIRDRAARPARGLPLLDRLGAHLRRRQTEKRLALMSPRLLADIGIDPDDIIGGVERKIIAQRLEDARRERLRALR